MDIIYNNDYLNMLKIIPNTIYNDDCLNILKIIPDNSIDFVITDPPFNVKLKYNTIKDDMSDENYRDWCIKWISEFKRIIKQGHVIIIFTGDAKSYWVFDAIYKSEIVFNHWIKWIKMNSQGNLPGTAFLNKVELAFLCSNGKLDKKIINRKEFNADYIIQNNMNINSKGSWNHIAQRPVELYGTLIKGFTKPGDIVLDPFMGSGTTAEACILTDRQYIGIEIDKIYYEKILKRIKEAVERKVFFNG